MEDWNRVRARGVRPWGRWLGEALLLLVAGAVLFSLAKRYDRGGNLPSAPGDPCAVELAHLKMLGHALVLHADEHEGRFPASVAGIEWRENLPGMHWAGLPAAVSRFHHPDSGAVSDWLYYPGHAESDPPDTILAAAPVAIGKQQDRRMLVRVNGVAEVVPERDFQRQVAGRGTP